jgi:hypothetical protein
MDFISRIGADLTAFRQRGGLGPDPIAAVYTERRAAWSLFARCMSDAAIEALRPYIFAYDQLPETPDDQPVPSYNFIAGEWRAAAEAVTMPALFDRRVPLARMGGRGHRRSRPR